MTQPDRDASRHASASERRQPEPAAELAVSDAPVADYTPALPGLALLDSPVQVPAVDRPRDVVGALRRQATCCADRHGPADQHGSGARLNRPTIRRSPDPVIRRAPTATPVVGEFTDPAAPGFVFVATGRPNEYQIKGSDVIATWDPEGKHWLSADGIVMKFVEDPTAGLDPGLDLRGGMPLPPQGRSMIPPQLGQNYFSMEHFKHLGVYDQMMALAELASQFPITPYQLTVQDADPDAPPMKFYRYHKFPIGFDDPQYVLGGGLNKVEITEEWQAKTLRKLIADRAKLLRSIRTDQPAQLVKAMEKFQANAMSTPFIATTSNRQYAESLYRDYPPGDGQRAVLLVIEGPKTKAFDFEEMYQTVQGAGGGQAQWNWRTAAKRAKDADQMEFGLPDLFIPLRGVSPLGFRIVDVVELSMPPPSLWSRLSADQRLQILQARKPSQPALLPPGGDAPEEDD